MGKNRAIMVWDVACNVNQLICSPSLAQANLLYAHGGTLALECAWRSHVWIPSDWFAGQCVVRYEGGRGPITALAVTPEECVIAGTAGGALLVFSPDPRRRITRRLQIASARPGPVMSAPSPHGCTIRFDAVPA